MKMHEVMDVNSRTSKSKQGKKELRRIAIERSANGGFIAEHSFHSGAGEYHDPEQHTFGKGEGKKLLSHLKEHFGIADKEDDGNSAYE